MSREGSQENGSGKDRRFDAAGTSGWWRSLKARTCRSFGVLPLHISSVKHSNRIPAGDPCGFLLTAPLRSDLGLSHVTFIVPNQFFCGCPNQFEHRRGHSHRLFVLFSFNFLSRYCLLCSCYPRIIPSSSRFFRVPAHMFMPVFLILPFFFIPMGDYIPW